MTVRFHKLRFLDFHWISLCTVHFCLISNCNTHTFLLKLSKATFAALKCFWHFRQRPKTDEKREKHLPLRKQDVSTQCPQNIQIPKQNKVCSPNTTCANQKLSGNPKLSESFDPPVIYVFVSFQKQSWSQISTKSPLCWNEGSCFDRKQYVYFTHPAVNLTLGL